MGILSNTPSKPYLPGARLETLALYGGFLLSGVVAVLLGPILPELETRWGIDHAQASSLFLAQFAATAVGALFTGFDLRRSIFGGYALVACGLVGLALSGWPLARLAVAFIGFGLGLALPASNLVVGLRHPERRGAALATLNLAWGIGATLSPLMFASLLGRFPATAALWLLAALATLAAGALAATPRTPLAPAASEAAPDRGKGNGLLARLAATLFFYVGVEVALGGWIVTFAAELGSGHDTVSMVIGSCFWGALLAGRAAAPLLLRRLREMQLFAASLTLATAGVVGILLAPSQLVVTAAAIAAGFGLAPLYPLTVAVLSVHVATAGARSSGWVFFCAGLGASALPWAIGQTAALTGALRAGFAVPLVGLAMVAVLFTSWRRLAV